MADKRAVEQFEREFWRKQLLAVLLLKAHADYDARMAELSYYVSLGEPLSEEMLARVRRLAEWLEEYEKRHFPIVGGKAWLFFD